MDIQNGGEMPMGRKWKALPKHARPYLCAHDRRLHEGSNYYLNKSLSTGGYCDDQVYATRCLEEEDSDFDSDDESRITMKWGPPLFQGIAWSNQINHDHKIIYDRHNKRTKILRILDVKLQYGSDPLRHKWEVDEVTNECKLEIDQSDTNEQGKKTIKFSFATDDIDKLLSIVVDVYEVKYMLCTNAIRLRLDLEMVFPTPGSKLDFNNLKWKVKFIIKQDGQKDSSCLFQSSEDNPSKKPKLDPSSAIIGPFIVIIPRRVRSNVKVQVEFKNDAGKFEVFGYQKFFPYTLPVDVQDYIFSKDAYIRLKAFWGCLCFDKGGICICEPGVFSGFLSPDEASCSRP